AGHRSLPQGRVPGLPIGKDVTSGLAFLSPFTDRMMTDPFPRLLGGNPRRVLTPIFALSTRLLLCPVLWPLPLRRVTGSYQWRIARDTSSRYREIAIDERGPGSSLVGHDKGKLTERWGRKAEGLRLDFGIWISIFGLERSSQQSKIQNSNSK